VAAGEARPRREGFLARLSQSLAGRVFLWLLGLVGLVLLVMVGPFMGREHERLLEQRLAAAQIAILPLLEMPDNQVSPSLRAELLANAGVRAAALKRDERQRLFLADDAPAAIGAAIDLRTGGLFDRMEEAVSTLTARPGRLVRVTGTPRYAGGDAIEAVIEEDPIRRALAAAIFTFSQTAFVIAIVVAGLIYLTLFALFVQPMEKLTRSMVRFSENPEDASRIIAPSDRTDEIGDAERELARMQTDLRTALNQKAHLAALGTAVAKIQHDLRNILASAQLASDRLAESPDPATRTLAAKLVRSIDRAVALATDTLRYGKADEAAPERAQIALAPLIEDVAAGAAHPRVAVVNAGGGIEAFADPEQLFRILLNLVRNAVQALEAKGGTVTIAAAETPDAVVITVSDDGPGIPQGVRGRLFQAFTGGGRSDGTGLGLAIARELARGHGGDLVLDTTGPDGTCFRLTLPKAGT